MLIAPIEGHRLWAPTDDTAPNPLLALETRVLAPLLAPFGGGRVVDIACGTGRWLSRLGGVGADACLEMLDRAAPGRVALADAAALPFRSGSADLVLCSFAAGYFDDLGAAVREMARIARPGGGVVVISDLHPAAGWKRTFRAGGTLYEMPYSPRPAAAACAAAGLRLAREITARFGEPERPVFRAAGKEDLFAQVADLPALQAGFWTRP